VKVDLLGLGMMSLLQDALEMIRRRGGRRPGTSSSRRPQVYAMLQQADTIGVFQVESRAQMATLPRLRPECFYDLVVQVAIIRRAHRGRHGAPVSPSSREARGADRAPSGTRAHPGRTLGVPLFQEQLLRMAMATAGFTGGEAEELRRAFGFKRSERAMKAVEEKLRAGMTRQGIIGEQAEAIIRSITAFALYGFPESHAASFALLAYASAYLKTHHPAAFYAALLNNQPMGFYHPATIVRDAHRHGQVIHPTDVNYSGWLCSIEPDGAVRLGLRYVRGLREEIGKRIEDERRQRPFATVADLVKRAGLHRDELTQLAQVGAVASLEHERRAAIWEAERAGRPAGPLYEELPDPPERSPLNAMTPEEEIIADYEGTGLSLGPHPMEFHREQLNQMKVARASDLVRMKHGAWVRVAGAVIVRQRPGTAKGFVFLNLEDETGLTNVIVRPVLFHRHRLALVNEPFLYVEGTLQHQDNVVSIRAERLWPLRHRLTAVPSHDFH
jgi:error-prone DNA polymerase